MLKRLGAVGAVIGVAALAVGSVGPVIGQASATGNDDDHHVVRVVSTNTEEEFIDVGEADFSLGDSFVFTSKLTKQGKTAGHAGVVCTVTSVEMAESECVATAWLRDGQITVQGLVAEEQSEELELAITGGTGAYDGAGGTLVSRNISATKEVLTFHITD
jgi:hypothetical protein